MGAMATFGAFSNGVLNILPVVLLILMPASIKLIIVNGGIMGTILKAACQAIHGARKYVAALPVFAATLAREFFIGSVSAKALSSCPSSPRSPTW
jgi:uncharacterized ion transporter superfamily protein YfcC